MELAFFTSPSALSVPGIPTPTVPGTTYYWRVDAVGLTGTTRGVVWSFTLATISAAPTRVVGR